MGADALVLPSAPFGSIGSSDVRARFLGMFCENALLLREQPHLSNEPHGPCCPRAVARHRASPTARPPLTMPKRSRAAASAGSTKRSRYGRRTRARVPRYRVRRVPRTKITASLGLPEKAYVRHKYVELFAQTTPEAGLPWVYRFSCNNVFDPNTTGGGHQPLYRDEFADIYNHYRVISSKCKVTINRLNNSTPLIPLIVLLDIDDDNTTNLDLRTEMENGRNVKLCSADLSSLKIMKSWNAKKHFPSATMQNLSAPAGSSPAEQSYFNIMLGPVDGGSQISFHAIVEIEYYVQWYEKKTPTPS